MNVMKPKQALLANLAQIIVDLQDYVETDLHSSLKSAERLLGSPEVTEWLAEMKKRGHAIPTERNGPWGPGPSG